MSKDIFSEIDVQRMQEALVEAKKAFDQQEVPVGAVLYWKERCIARSFNQMEMRQDASAHAEMLCIQEGARAIEDWRLVEATLYTTLEPCLMCAGALLLARVKRVVWGAPDLRHGANGSLIDVFTIAHPTHTIKIEGGVLEHESRQLMQEFFQRRRDEKNAQRCVR